jgi:hypothetical protein
MPTPKGPPQYGVVGGRESVIRELKMEPLQLATEAARQTCLSVVGELLGAAEAEAIARAGVYAYLAALPHDEETVERVALAIKKAEVQSDLTKLNVSGDLARAALSALLPEESEEPYSQIIEEPK